MNVSRLLCIAGCMHVQSTLAVSAQKLITIPEGMMATVGLNTTFVAHFALFVSVLLIGTIIAGKIFKRVLGLPVIAGQILGGIILGPTVINCAGWRIFHAPLALLDYSSGITYQFVSSDLFMFFVVLLSSALSVAYLLWIAGHETDIQDILQVGTTATLAGILGAIVPVVLIAGFLYYGLGGSFTLVRSLGIGLVFAATSVSIPVAMLFAQKKMHLRSSKATLGAAIIDDIFAVVLLGVFLVSVQSGTFGPMCGTVHHDHDTSIIHSLLSMAATLMGLSLVGYFVMPPALRWLDRARYVHLILPVATGVMLLYFATAEIFGGLAGITGAYFAGLFHRRGDHRHRAEKKISPFVNGLLLPLFLGSIGLQVDLRVLNPKQWVLVSILLLLAIVSKLVACYVATGLSNLVSRRGQKAWSLLDGYLFGSSMVARGEVGLVVATILRGGHLITPGQYIISVVVIVLTTIATPIMLSLGFIHLERQLVPTKDKDEYALDLGAFPIVGTTQMFNIILGCVRSKRACKTSITLSEGRKIVHLEGEGVEIILTPKESILFRGDRERITEILNEVKGSVEHEVERIYQL